jgi:hypothetical protein
MRLNLYFMTLHKEILHFIALIDEVFITVNQKPLLQNLNFELDELSHDEWIRLHLLKKEEWPEVFLEIFEGGIYIRIDRIFEACEESYNGLLKNHTPLQDAIYAIFTSELIIEYCGNNFRKILMKNKKYAKPYNWRFYRNFYLYRSKCIQKYFDPIFPDNFLT